MKNTNTWFIGNHEHPNKTQAINFGTGHIQCIDFEWVGIDNAGRVREYGLMYIGKEQGDASPYSRNLTLQATTYFDFDNRRTVYGMSAADLAVLITSWAVTARPEGSEPADLLPAAPEGFATLPNLGDLPRPDAAY